MAFLFVTLNEIEEIRDEKHVLTTLRVKCTELAPRNFNVNLIKQPVAVLNQITALIGQPVMMPIKEGKTSDGQAYFQLEAGQIIPVSLDYAASINASSANASLAEQPQAQSDSEPTPQEQPKPALNGLGFNNKANK